MLIRKFIYNLINRFKKQYKVSLLDSKWFVLKDDLKITIIPRESEYIWNGAQYFKVLNVVHSTMKKHHILIIVEPVKPPQSVENEVVEK